MSGCLVSLGEYVVTRKIFPQLAEKYYVFTKFVEYTHGIPGEQNQTLWRARS
jgi:hypothetical protein